MTGTLKRRRSRRPSRRAGGSTTEHFAGSAVRIVNDLERSICGDDAVLHAPLAEGLALAGRHSASLVADGRAGGLLRVAARGVPWVVHRVIPDQALVAGPGVLELVAGSAQQAIDHTLAAHHLAIRLRVPCVCTLPRSIARRLHLLELPGAEAVAELRGLVRKRGHIGPGASDVGATIAEVLRSVSKRTGRRLAELDVHSAEGARHALVVSGEAAEPARAVVDALREAGSPCALVVVALLRPFPGEALRELLGGHDVVAVVSAVQDGGSTELLDAVRAVARPGALRELAGRPGELLAEVAEAFAVDLESGDGARAPGPRVTFGALPAGPASERFLLDSVAHLGPLGALSLARPELGNEVSSVVVGGAPGRPRASELDVLFAAHPTHLTLDALAKVRTGGVVLLPARCDGPEALFRMLSPSQRSVIGRGELELRFIDLRSLEAKDALDVDVALRGALLACSAKLAQVTGCTGGILAALERAGGPRVAHLTVGADASVVVSPDDAALVRSEPQLREPSRLPRMPAASEAEPSAESVAALRHFHLTGRGAPGPLVGPPLRPVAIVPTSAGAAASPLLFSDASAPRERAFVRPLGAVLRDSLDGVEAGGARRAEGAPSERRAEGASSQDIPVVRDHLDRIVAYADRIAGVRPEGASAPEVIPEACAAFLAELDASDAARASVEEELDRFVARLDIEGTLVSNGAQVPLLVALAAIRKERAPRLEAFGREAEMLSRRLGEMLSVDAAHERGASGAGLLGASLGDAAMSFVDPELLSRALPAYRGSRRIEPPRKARMEAAKGVLDRHLAELRTSPGVVLIHGVPLPDGIDLGGVRRVGHPDGLSVAVGLFEGLAEGLVEVLRAVRVARLEVEAAYDEALHGETLARFCWRSFGADELLLVPRVIVVESATRLRGTALASLSTLLRSGRPIQVLVCVLDDTPGAEMTGSHAELGYLCMAHRDALVVQSTLARPEHLAAGLERMAGSLRPSVAIVASASWGTADPARLADARHEGRSTPCFRYVPDAGPSWADRFDLEGNPSPERAWTVRTVPYLDADGAEQALSVHLTFADAAALEPAYREHFWVIPTDAWSDEQVELASWVARSDAEPPPEVPFVWVRGDDGALARAVVTRELAFACRDRMRTWRILSELAGHDNEYARRAAEAARDEAQQEAAVERERLDASFEQRLEETRAGAAGEAMDRLVSVLINLDDVSLPARGTPASGATLAGPASGATLAGPASGATLAPTAEPAPAAEEPEPEEDEELSFDDPYIDTPLCTTCNECTNLNGQLFEYDGEKQAYIADATAGTFKELVTAAELCPVDCIHPGKPRPGDSTVTDELLARAAKYN